MKLFGIDIAAEVANGVQAAGGVLRATLVKVAVGGYVDGALASGPTKTPTSYPCRGFVEMVRARQIAGTSVQEMDRKVVLLGKTISRGTVEPATDDKVTIDGTTYYVVAIIDRDPAAATWSLLCRPA